MKKPFSTIVVKTIIDGQEVKVRFANQTKNHRKFLARLRGVNISQLVQEEGDRGALGGGGIIFNPPPAPDPVIPTINAVFELNPDLRQFGGTHTDAASIDVLIDDGAGAIIVDAPAVIEGSNWSIDLSGYVFSNDVTYFATATAKSSTNDTADITKQDVYAPPQVTVIFQLEEPYALKGTYSNANTINVVVKDADNLLVAQGAPTFAEGLWEFDLSSYQLLDGMTYSVEVEANNADGKTFANASSTFVAPPPEFFSLINDPDLVLVNQASIIDGGTLLTNWETAAYPYHYAYVPDNGKTTYDVGEELTITIGRRLHPDDTNSFKPLVVKHTGNITDAAVPEHGYNLSTYTPYMFAYIDDGSDSDYQSQLVNIGHTAELGVWYHYTIVMKRADKSITIYVDGVKKGSKSNLVEFPADTPHKTVIGQNVSGGNVISPLRAMWRDIRFYHRALSDEEIAQVSNELNRS